jgi:AMIN domain-containing protein/OmpA family protein
MRTVKTISALALMFLIFVGSAQAQDSQFGNLAEQQRAPTVLGGTGLFNTFSTRTLCRGEFNFGLFWNNFNRDPGDLDINQVPFNITVGLTDRWELWVNWVTWQQTTSRNPFLLSGYQYNAVRRFGNPSTILGPAVGGRDSAAAFFPGTGAPFGGILPVLGRFGTPANIAANQFSPGGPGATPVVGLGPALITNLPAFYNDLPFFGEVDFIGFDDLGRPVFGVRQSSNGSGDVFIGSKVNLLDPNKHWFSMALGGYIKIPISREDHARARGRTSGEFEYGPVLMFGQETADKRFRVYENIGYIHTGDIERGGVKVLDLRDKLLLGAGLSIAINRHVEFLSEVSHTRYIGGGTPSLGVDNPVDLNIGLRFFLRDGTIAFGGAYRYSFLSSIEGRTFQELECIEIREKDHHDVHSFSGDKDDKPKTRIECRPRNIRFRDRGDSHGFVGFFSLGLRKPCPPPPVPTCALEAPARSVTRGDRVTLTVRPNTPGYNDSRVSYDYRWEVRDAQGRSVPVSGTGPSVEVSTSRLTCGSYTVTTTVSVTVNAEDCPADCPTTGQSTCSASFEVTEPPCPAITCVINASATTVTEGERVRLRAVGAGGGNITYRWSASGGRLSSTTGSEVTLDTTGVLSPITVTVSVATDLTRCDEPCPGGECSTTINVREIERRPPEVLKPIIPCGPIFFPFNSARINNEHKACLDEIALRLQQDPRAQVVIDGHRDSAERIGISLTRANNARDYLVGEKRIDPARITVRNFGDTCPHELGDPNLNRRVEFWILPEGATVDVISTEKRCAPGAAPRVITTESPAPAVERRPTRRTPRTRTRKPEPGASPTEEEEARDRSAGASGATNTDVHKPVALSGTGTRAEAVRPKIEQKLAPATLVRSVRSMVVGGVLRIYVDTDGAAQFKAFSLADPSRIVLDVEGVTHAFGSKTIQVGVMMVDRVRVGQPSAGTVRIVLDIRGKVSYHVTREGSSLVITIGDAGLVSKFITAESTAIMTSR